MKFMAFFVVILAALAMFIGTTEANPKVKAGSVVKNGLRVINAAGTAHDAYEAIKHKKQG
ncbi:moricin-like [Helicoverpa armigera]|uniref:moricin-like n=1 Tax=Helicoverpa armigera TaxID=29058 RepID=UPI003083916D